MKMREMALVAALGMVTLQAGVASAYSPLTARADVDMRSTGVDSDARGRVKMQVRGFDDGRLEVQARRLGRKTAYELVLNGVRVTSFTTTGGGNANVRFRTRPSGRSDRFLGFDPRNAVVVVRDGAGRDVLGVTVPEGVRPGGHDDGDVVCCIPDDGGPECEDRTPAECVAQGGTVSVATSCLPNPCAGTPPPPGGDVICCIPDDAGPECEDRTLDACALQGGIVLTAASCTANPCAGTPPSDPDVRCCLPDDAGPECEDRTPGECAAAGGVNLGPGSCTPNPCSQITPSPGGGTGAVRVRCERRAGRSKASVDGNDLAPGSYRARLVSGGNEAFAPFRSASGDEAEFDFDSDGGDVAAGAVAIAPDFLQGNPPTALGQILDASNAVVAEAQVTCQLK